MATTPIPALARAPSSTETDAPAPGRAEQATGARMMAVVEAVRSRTPAPPRPAPRSPRPLPAAPPRQPRRRIEPQQRPYATGWRQRRPWLIVGALVLIGLAVRVVLMRSIWVD